MLPTLKSQSEERDDLLQKIFIYALKRKQVKALQTLLEYNAAIDRFDVSCEKDLADFVEDPNFVTLIQAAQDAARAHDKVVDLKKKIADAQSKNLDAEWLKTQLLDAESKVCEKAKQEREEREKDLTNMIKPYTEKLKQMVSWNDLILHHLKSNPAFVHIWTEVSNKYKYAARSTEHRATHTVKNTATKKKLQKLHPRERKDALRKANRILDMCMPKDDQTQERKALDGLTENEKTICTCLLMFRQTAMLDNVYQTLVGESFRCT